MFGIWLKKYKFKLLNFLKIINFNTLDIEIYN